MGMDEVDSCAETNIKFWAGLQTVLCYSDYICKSKSKVHAGIAGYIYNNQKH